MARSINCGTDVRRSDTFFVDPREIEVDWTLNGRTDTFTPEAVARLALDMREHGQLEPVISRSRPGKKIQLIIGYNRLRAALENIKEDPGFRLETRVLDGISDRDAFLMNIRENMIRTETSPLDNANNIRRLLNNYGFKASEVSELYKRSTSWVSEMMALLTLPEAVKDAVAAGELATSTGVLLSKLPAAEAEAALAEGVAAVEAAEEDERAEEERLESQAIPEAAVEGDGPTLTVDDESLAAAIDQLSARPKAEGKPKPKKKAKKDLTPAEAQNRKTVRQANISKAVRKAAEAKGLKARKTASDLTALIKFRQDDLSRKLVGYFAGEVSEDDLIEAFDLSESPIVADTPKKGPVKSLARA
jgi:ParB/RepB/Spo0J family partition protein